MNKFGSVRYSRAVRETIWTQYREGGAALTALTARSITVLGVEWDITAVTGDWRASLAQELALVANPVLPLAPPPGSQFKKESAMLLKQLSKLSFDELQDISLSLDVAPAKPPPPTRPAAPPSRPPPPSSPAVKTSESKPKKAPSAAPPRPKPPPARPPPPPTKKPQSPEPEPKTKPAPTEKAEEDEPQTKSGGGFSDLFSAPPDPDLDTDIPLSLSSDSLATASGEATPAPTKPPLPPVDPDHPVDLAPRGSVDSGRVTILENTKKNSPTPEEVGTDNEESESESSESSDSETEESEGGSGASTPTNEDSRPPGLPPTGPPPLTSRAPPGPPPRVPGRPGPPPVPRR